MKNKGLQLVLVIFLVAVVTEMILGVLLTFL